ncbi:hypothetical protein ACQUW5_08545 [Legionella sp. CNM-1927-20]|uniref:hypothetical protein n=1 Tax=Legionella sp. CNM-1927-20 TaxID=3422221 RepID=UPI00403B14FB
MCINWLEVEARLRFINLKEHQHTLKLDFEASTDLAPIIQEEHHLGLAGSSLTAREVVKENNLVKFSIYCGRETQESTQFNATLKPDTQVNITEPAKIALSNGIL